MDSIALFTSLEREPKPGCRPDAHIVEGPVDDAEVKACIEAALPDAKKDVTLTFIDPTGKLNTTGFSIDAAVYARMASGMPMKTVRYQHKKGVWDRRDEP